MYALVCIGMAVLMCHLPSQLSLEMTKELIPTSAASGGVSGKLLCCLSPLPPFLGHSNHSSLPGPCGQCCRLCVPQKSLSSCPQVQAACFIMGWVVLPRTGGRGFRSGHGDNSQAPADVTFVCVLGLQGPFRTGLCAVPLSCHMQTGS